MHRRTPAGAWRNWAGNQRATARAVLRPGGTGEVAAAVRAARAAGARVKAVGSSHSFTDIACADDHRLDTDGMTRLVGVDRERRQVTVQAGMPLWRLNSVLAEHGLAMPNLGDIEAQTIAGAISTGTHGTGARHGGLASFVSGLTLVTGCGEVVSCSAEQRPDLLAAARVGLGALGVLTEVTLACSDAFVLEADERPATVADVLADLDDLVAGNDHFEFYWFPYTDLVQIKRNNRVAHDDRPLPRWRGWLDDELLANTVFAAACRLGRALPATVPAIGKVAARALTARTYTARPDRVFCTPRRVPFVEMEYALPRAALPEAFTALRGIVGDLSQPVQFPVEVRFAAADDAWLSTSHGRASAYIAVQQYAGAPYARYFDAFEHVAVALEGRPHWGKLHTLDAASLRQRYPRFDDFLALRDSLDPDRVFANAYTQRVLGP